MGKKYCDFPKVTQGAEADVCPDSPFSETQNMVQMFTKVISNNLNIWGALLGRIQLAYFP